MDDGDFAGWMASGVVKVEDAKLGELFSLRVTHDSG